MIKRGARPLWATATSRPGRPPAWLGDTSERSGRGDWSRRGGRDTHARVFVREPARAERRKSGGLARLRDSSAFRGVGSIGLSTRQRALVRATTFSDISGASKAG